MDAVLYLVALGSALVSTLLLSWANRQQRFPLWGWPRQRSPAAQAVGYLGLAAGLYAAARSGDRLGDELAYGLALLVLLAPAPAVTALHNRRVSRARGRDTSTP